MVPMGGWVQAGDDRPPTLMFGHVRVRNAYSVFTNKRSCEFRGHTRASFGNRDFITGLVVLGGGWNVGVVVDYGGIW